MPELNTPAKDTAVITIDESEFDFDNLTEEIERVLTQASAIKARIKAEAPPTPNPGLVQRRWPSWVKWR
jgi:hypothetical protein